MPLSDGYKAIDTAWASGVGADRTDPDDAALTPPLVVANGWPASFSADAGDTPRRAVFNEMYWRRDSALLDIRNHGVLPWDTEVDTLEGGVKQVNGVLYRALADNGPTYANAVNPTDAGQTVWESISGQSNAPSAPNAPTATAPESETLDWSWNCPLDGGSIITEFDFQWRASGAAMWSTTIVVTTPRYELTGLTNGQPYEARVRARNAIDDGPWSSAGSATPQGTVPGGGATFALRADGGDAEVDLDWLEPDDGGETITGYTVQWRESGQSFTTGRQTTVTATEHTVTSLTNDTEYFFRVRAANGQGPGPWSNEASATPAADTTPTPTPDTAPTAPTNLTGTPRRPLAVDWTWELPNSNGGQRIESYDHQWRYSGDSWSGNLTTGLETSYLRHSIADTTRGVQARVRARNSIGPSAWGTTVTVSQSDLADGAAVPTQRHQFTSTQNWNWPYDDLDRAAVLLYGPDSINRDSGKDISLIDGSWRGGASDGTTLWFLDTAANTARAYVAATRARDAAKDISLGSAEWRSTVSDGTTLWFVNDSSQAQAYAAATRVRDATRDITLTGTEFSAATSDGTTLWFVNTTTNSAHAYVAATRARDANRDISLGSGTWASALGNGTTIWFVDESANEAQAYTAATLARDSGKDIDLGIGSWQSAVSDEATLWFVNGNTNTAVAYSAPSLAQVIVGSNTYTTSGDADGVVTQALSGIADNATFAITVSGSGFVEIYPQC